MRVKITAMKRLTLSMRTRKSGSLSKAALISFRNSFIIYPQKIRLSELKYIVEIKKC